MGEVAAAFAAAAAAVVPVWAEAEAEPISFPPAVSGVTSPKC